MVLPCSESGDDIFFLGRFKPAVKETELETGKDFFERVELGSDGLDRFLGLAGFDERTD